MPTEKGKEILRELNYYFLRLPSLALSSSNTVYKKLDSWVQERKIESERKARVIMNLESLLGDSTNKEERELMGKRYFSILSCDEIDAYLQLFKSSDEIRKFVKVEGEEIFKSIADRKKGCILLTAHYGGAFFIFNIIKELGGKPQFLLRPIREEAFREDPVKWAYMKLRLFSVKKAIGEKMIFTQGRGTKNKILLKLERGYHIVIMFDVPPIFTKGKIGEVHFLGKIWFFPLGFLELLLGRDFAVIPFFTYMNDQWERIFKFYPPYWIEREEDLLSSFQKSISIFEQHLRKRPEQWFFFDDAQVFWLKENGNG